MVKKICLNCGKEFEVYDEKVNYHHHSIHSNIYKRPSNAVTCCSRCSREYQRKKGWKKEIK